MNDHEIKCTVEGRKKPIDWEKHASFIMGFVSGAGFMVPIMVVAQEYFK